MRRSLIIIVLILFCNLNFPIFCENLEITNQMEVIFNEIEASNKETDQGEKNKIRNTVLKTNIKYLESRVLKKIKRAESRLAKYKIKLGNSENGQEVQLWLKKIESTQKTIQDLNEALFTIDMWKTKII